MLSSSIVVPSSVTFVSQPFNSVLQYVSSVLKAVHLVLQASTNLSQEVHSAHCALPTPQVQLGPIFVIATKDTLVQKAALVECAEREATRIQQVLNRALFVALENIQASTEQLLL